MKTWIAEPRDTLVVRDGRPIQEGSPRMRSLDFPWPSTIAGCVRTRIGTNERGAFTLPSKEAREIQVHGPWLATLDEAGQIAEHLLPAPRDCLWVELDRERDRPPRWQRRRLAPLPGLPAGCATDLDPAYHLVGLQGEALEKKAGRGPAFWRWSELQHWLLTPAPISEVGSDFGHDAPLHEARVHVRIDPKSQTASDGKLFSTDGLRFSTKTRERLGVVFRCHDERLRAGPAFLGGERRISFLRQARGMDLPELPGEFTLGEARLARVVLLTPAIFRDGFAPRTFGEGTTVIAAAVQQPEIISGWDFELAPGPDGKPRQRGPKPTRRMAPAGSVYWVRLGEGVDAREWAMGIWMNSVSDDPQDRCDGFGLAVVGVG